MADDNELNTAVERVRRVKAGEALCAVYDAQFRFAEAYLNSDYQTIAEAYLKLGTRRPVEQVAWNDDGTMTLVVRGHVEPVRSGDAIVYIQAEVPNAD